VICAPKICEKKVTKLKCHNTPNKTPYIKMNGQHQEIE
jgi:hypothetical protein